MHLFVRERHGILAAMQVWWVESRLAVLIERIVRSVLRGLKAIMAVGIGMVVGIVGARRKANA